MAVRMGCRARFGHERRLRTLDQLHIEVDMLRQVVGLRVEAARARVVRADADILEEYVDSDVLQSGRALLGLATEVVFLKP